MTDPPMPNEKALATLRKGVAIPAHPLALTAKRRLDERRQRALTRYYLDAGAGGLAVGVHSTQFEIRQRQHALFEPVLALAMEEVCRFEKAKARRLVRVAGICGKTPQATAEAELARGLGYDAGLLSLAALRNASDDELADHCRAVAQAIPLIGFYLQPAVGGRPLSVGFWRRFAEIPNVVAIKIAPFNRYQTLDVVRAVAEAGRALATPEGDGIALYTGNDDNILGDLLGAWSFEVGGKTVTQHVVGGLLGHWAYWTRKAVDLLQRCQKLNKGQAIDADMLELNRQVTDMNAAVFDAANGFAGVLPGMHEVLRRQGLLAGTWCLNPRESLSPGQAEQITRVCAAYPRLTDDDFVAEHRDKWLSG